MNRNEFIKSCAYACLSGVAITTLLQSCDVSKIISVPLSGSFLILDLKEFETVKKEKTTYKEYIVVRNEQLKFPICVYRINSTEFTALNLECTHQGAELQVFGDKLVCPAHGSEFNDHGQVQNGPASSNLRTFPVTIENYQLKISLS
ncbi:MAG: Rieske 2Fe-2S domain-containing protein [Bacteroidota bacterium]